MDEEQQIRHVLGLSGGRDSAALAVYMRQNFPDLEMEYYFTDTGKELPEVYQYLWKLEGFLGKPILRLNSERDFDFWLKQNNNYLPSPQSRWCTVRMKIRPFENWVRPMLAEGATVYSYIAIRADEQYRTGYASKYDRLIPKLPFREDGIDKQGVLDLLEAAGLGLPEYYSWRSRSGCTFCFFQRKIEWVRLLERHPEAFEEAKAYEKTAAEHETPFTWSEGESLEELSRPERIDEIKKSHAERVEKAKGKVRQNPLRDDQEPIDVDDLYGQAKGCLACHK